LAWRPKKRGRIDYIFLVNEFDRVRQSGSANGRIRPKKKEKALVSDFPRSGKGMA
jgi:hypothetical protein